MSAPDPLVAADVDLRGFSSFMLDVDRLLASELVALATPEEAWAAMLLWCRAWKQQPPGSLPNDDRTLASFSGTGKRWPKVRDMALRGFVLCSDGRLYHRVLCEEVEKAWKRRTEHDKRRERDAERLRQWREKSSAETREETPSETRFNGRRNAYETARDRTGQDRTGQDISSKANRSSEPTESVCPSPSATAGWQKVNGNGNHSKTLGSRLPEGWFLPDEWKAWARSYRADWDEQRIVRESLVFRDFWHAKAGADARKADWLATWRNWIRRAQ